jgi:hypothetical protein
VLSPFENPMPQVCTVAQLESAIAHCNHRPMPSPISPSSSFCWPERKEAQEKTKKRRR